MITIIRILSIWFNLAIDLVKFILSFIMKMFCVIIPLNIFRVFSTYKDDIDKYVDYYINNIFYNVIDAILISIYTISYVWEQCDMAPDAFILFLFSICHVIIVLIGISLIWVVLTTIFYFIWDSMPLIHKYISRIKNYNYIGKFTAWYIAKHGNPNDILKKYE